MERTFYIEVSYDDGSEFHFNVEIEGADHEIMAHLMQITRGALMASGASRSICYNDQGFDVCSYVK